MAEVNDELCQIGKAKCIKKDKKVDKGKKIPKILSYLFLRNGLTERNIPIQTDGFVNVSDILDVYSDFTEEEIHEAVSADGIWHGQHCTQTGALQIKVADQSKYTAAAGVQTAATCSQQTEPRTSQPQTPQHIGMTSQPGDIRISKYLSFLLRHGAEKEGFKLQAGGFLYVDEILHRRKAAGWSMGDIQRVVATNDKQRFHTEPHPDNGRLRIRANQGHSVEVKELVLRPITSAEEFSTVVHGTYLSKWNSIKEQGLKRMNRSHIHFAPGEPGESGVISGMRKSCEVLIYIHLSKALKDGLEFFLSANNVILSPGDADGSIKPKYFASVIQRLTGTPLK